MRGLLDALPVLLLIEWLLWRLDPQREAWKSEWRAWGQGVWAFFIYQTMSNYPSGELAHWYSDAPDEGRPDA